MVLSKKKSQPGKATQPAVSRTPGKRNSHD